MENNFETQEKNFLILKLLRKNWLLITLLTVLITMCFASYSIFLTKPVYTASRSFILRTELVSGGTGMANGALAVDVLMPQMSEYFNSQKYNEMANEEYKSDKYVKYNGTSISRGAVSFSYSEGSLIAKLSYTDVNANVAIEKLKAIFDTADKFFDDIENYKGENIDTAYTIDLIPTDNAQYDNSRFVIKESSSLRKFIMIGIAAGLAFSVVIVLIKNSLDTTVKDRRELEEITGTDILATIEKV